MIQFNESFSKLCRCCMENGNINLFTTVYEAGSLVKVLEICISEEICPDNRLPNNICQRCYDKIISCHSFIINCKNVQLQLLDILKKNTLTLEEKAVLSENDTLDIGSEIKYESSDEDYSLGRKSKFKKKKNSDMEMSRNEYNKFEFKLETSDKKYTEDSKNISPSMIFNSEIDAKQHFLANCSDEERKGIKCKNSQKEIYEKPFSIEHMKNHTNECTDLPKIEKTAAVEKLKNSFQKYICIDCGEYFEFMKHLEQHCRKTGHSIPRRFSCKICSKKFLSNTRLNDHMRTHNNDRPYKCSECGMTFTSSSNLKRHNKKHTGEKSYFCEVCSRGFIQKHTLTVHMRLHNGETPYVCELCGKGYRTKPLLHQHMYKHKDTETQIIKYRKYYLKYGKMKVECKICKKIITKSALYNHMKIQHGDGLKKFLCNLCGKTYATKMSLGVHMNIHTKKISYDCTECSKSFTHQNYLKTHLMLHSGERPHCCDLCGKTFVQRTHLDRHMRTHTGAKPYACTYCDKTFALNENLKVHTRIHTGETPHHCSVCGKGFFNSSSKKKHEINIHQIHHKIKQA